MPRVIASFPLPIGGRHVILVEAGDPEFPEGLIDIPVGPLGPDADIRVIDRQIRDDDEACRRGVEYMLHCTALGRPAADALAERAA